jgi:RNA polymerase sigma-70 factor (ECF subfamily)
MAQMASEGSTSWGLLDAAAAGNREARAQFATRYQPLIRAYFAARWQSSPLLGELDDAIQDVFVECLRSGGVLEHANPEFPGGFRAFLYGVVRNIARRFEGRRSLTSSPEIVDPDRLEADEDSLSRVFDRAWAQAIMREAAQRQAALAALAGRDAQRRLELLRLRFQEDLPIREIAQRWKIDACVLHREYAKAREEFRTALQDVVRSHHPLEGMALERECNELLTLLS